MDSLDALLKLTALERLPRSGWLLAGVKEAEPIAAHGLGTCLVALALGPKVEPELDLDRTVSLAALHDAPEALLTDLPKVASELLPPGAKRSAEERAAEELLAPLSSAALSRWREYHAGETREARFVKLCDKLQMGVRALAYTQHGARGLDDFRRSMEELDASEFAPCSELRTKLLAAFEKQMPSGSTE